MAEIVRLAKVEDAPAEPMEFLLTETAKDCLRALHGIHAADGSRFAMIAGVQGVGKTKALCHFPTVEQNVYAFKIYKSEGTSSAISEILMDAFCGEKPNGKSISARRNIPLKHWGNSRMTFLFDEAHNFEADGMEWVTQVAESAGWSVGFIGGADLPYLVEKCQSLSGRIPFPVIIRNAAREDAIAVAHNLGVTDHDAVHLLTLISQSKGGLRKVALTIEAASTFAREGDVTAEHIRKVAGNIGAQGGK